ncbi:MAG: protein translocase subunit SecF, partial [Polyangiaceae bacterium]
MEFFKPGRTFDFMGARWFWIPFSFAMVALSTLSLFWPGPNYGTDFRGGTEIEVAFEKPITAAQLRTAVEKLHYQTPDIVAVVGQQPNQYLVRVQEVSVLDDALRDKLKKSLCLTEDTKVAAADPVACPENARATEVKFSQGGDKIDARYDQTPDLLKVREQVKSAGVALRDSQTNVEETNVNDHRVEIQLESKGDQLMNGLRSELGADTVPEHPLRVEWVGPKAGKQLRDSARNSVAIAIVFIMLYLAFRFDLRFAPGVVVACIHDAMVVIGFFVIFHKEITLSTIAAVLTIVGYSMNDTVVVYDRI